MASWRAAFDADPTERTPSNQDHAAWPAMPFPHHFASGSGASTMPPPSSETARFLHTQCDQELFSAEYLRSNKASGHKNLRCFPHCCGGHNPKSFCGAGLVVECALPRAQIALGCFEEVPKPTNSIANSGIVLSPDADADADADTSPPQSSSLEDPEPVVIYVGDAYSRRQLFQELKSSENPFGKWFKGVPVLSATDVQRFHLNGNRQSWHYGWQSSRLNCKNLHVFKVYFFQATSDDTLRCIAELSSPPFRISSSRKARKTFRTSPSLQSLGSISDDQLSVPQSSPRRYEDDERLSVDSADDSIHSLPLTLASLRGRASFDLSGASTPTTYASTPTATYVDSANPHHLPHRRVSGASTLSSSTSSSHRGDVLPSLASRFESFASTPSATYRGQPDRKRLTRSSSLQTDYYSSSSSSSSWFPTSVPVPREPRAQTFLGEEPPPRNRMLSLTSLLNSSSPPPPAPPPPPNNQLDHVADDAVRSALPSIQVPALRLDPARGRVSTPVSDLMHLRLETPRRLSRPASTSAIGAVASAAKPRRKRNRSADSGASANRAAWFDGPLLREIAPDGEWDLVARAHALALLTAVAGRLSRGPDESSFQLAWLARDGRVHSVELASATKPALARLCRVLLDASARLLSASAPFLRDVRSRMQALFATSATSAADVIRGYEAMVDAVVPRVEAALAAVVGHASTDPEHPSVLVDVIRAAEDELAAEEWLRGVQLFDDDDDEYPFLEFVSGYAEAVRLAATRPQLGPLSPSTTAAARHRRGLTGDWRLVHAASADDVRVAVAAWLPPSALQQQLELYEAQAYRLLELDDSLTVSLGNSLVHAAAAFRVHLGRSEPQCVVPVDHFPHALTRRHLLLAYKAWRVRSVDDAGGSAVAVQSMRWPSESDSERTADGRRRLRRTRVTTHFCAVSPERIHVRFVVEGSVAEHATLCAMAFAPPNDADMRALFQAPGSWELLAHATLHYERVY